VEVGGNLGRKKRNKGKGKMEKEKNWKRENISLTPNMKISETRIPRWKSIKRENISENTEIVPKSSISE